MIYNTELALQKINGELLLLELGDHPSELYEPIRYILSLGGKRLRPILTLMACSLYSDDYLKALSPAIAIEVFHNFSLIHDDIMDQAAVRRGKATVHTKWNVPTAILSGDVALVEAYKILMKIDDPLKITAFNLFSEMAKKVCEGQQLDMVFEKKDKISVAQYMEMIRFKTAVLLGFSLQIGALAGGAPESDGEKLKLFGENIGLAFQIKDDYLDAYGDEAKVGKTIGGDILINKKTYLFTRSMEIADKKTSAHLSKLYEPDYNPKTKVKDVMAVYNELNMASECEREIANFYNLATANLNGLSTDLYKKARLKNFADELIGRLS